MERSFFFEENDTKTSEVYLNIPNIIECELGVSITAKKTIECKYEFLLGYNYWVYTIKNIVAHIWKRE